MGMLYKEKQAPNTSSWIEYGRCLNVFVCSAPY